jgi:hypothetical protein
MTSAIQFLTRPRAYSYSVAAGDPRYLLVRREFVWATPSTASPPRASAAKRRSTRRSPASNQLTHQSSRGPAAKRAPVLPA